jgi:hypothetical protein
VARLFLTASLTLLGCIQNPVDEMKKDEKKHRQFVSGYILLSSQCDSVRKDVASKGFAIYTKYNTCTSDSDCVRSSGYSLLCDSVSCGTVISVSNRINYEQELEQIKKSHCLPNFSFLCGSYQVSCVQHGKYYCDSDSTCKYHY